MNKSFQGVYVNSQQISYLLESWFSSKGYKAQVLGNENSFVVQAKKEGFFRTFTGADSAFTQTSSPPSEGSPYGSSQVYGLPPSPSSSHSW